MISPDDILALVLSGGGLLLAFPVVRALAERIRSRPAASESKASEDLLALREEMLGELQELRQQIGDMAERLDFAERLLAKQRDVERLAPPH